jgi:hypothetical protein
MPDSAAATMDAAMDRIDITSVATNLKIYSK